MKVGLIGCGFIGHKHVNSLLQAKGMEIAAICDMSEMSLSRMKEKLQEQQGANETLRTYTDYSELLDDEDIDIITIAVNSGLHGRIAKEALIHGKHVIVEKPMALSLQEAREMNRLSEAFGGKLAVCHQKRFFSHLIELKRIVSRGGFGELLFGSVQLSYNRNDAYYEQAKWRGTWEMDGGVLLNQAIHNLDLMLWLLGEPVEAYGVIQRRMRKIEAEDSASGIVRLASGAIMQIQATVCSHPDASQEKIELIGSQGSVQLSGKWMENVDRWKLQEHLPITYQEVDPYVQLYSDIKKSISQAEQPFVSGAEGIRALEVIMALYQSSISGRPVKFPIQDFSTLEMRSNEPY
ncbi:Gfo/Idh/MocA family protein [Marinicrinis lubricantis]|uniref:Gfo/Idh/MocA family protein n=1 Tax=Marinicrinis lubricantis TaxID=2086470 RepID=A0ABW1IUG4_9BACL